jgi:predicted amidohydrolase YtcJ
VRAVHPWAVINGGINVRQFGDAAYDMAPLALIQNSGVTWGLGSDGSRANQILPFTTLWWAWPDGGRPRSAPAHQPRAALAAHEPQRVFVFKEPTSVDQAGKLADLLVLDRDYLTVPADQIKDIAPVTMVVGASRRRRGTGERRGGR